jgi:ATP-dependent protease ClpP protease subunit
MRPCFVVSNKSSTDKNTAVLTVFGDIGLHGVQAKDFMVALDAVTATNIDVEISSNGGDVFAAITMFNGLRASGKTIRTKVMGIAASAASLLFLAGEKREMPGNTCVMVHSAATLPENFTAAGMREAAATLEKVDAICMRFTCRARA